LSTQPRSSFFFFFFFFSFFFSVCLPHRPVLKFSVIKLVVLVMWWQGVFVNILEQQPAMKEADDGLLKRGWTSKEVGFCIQNFLCIIEMLFIGIGFHYAFHYTVGERIKTSESELELDPPHPFSAPFLICLSSIDRFFVVRHRH
jgi:hypothetical protein